MPSTLAQKRVVDEVLTNVARGYVNASFIASNLFPFVPVNKEGGKIPQFSAEAFRIYNTERAIRAKSNRISPQGVQPIDYVLAEHDIEYPMDYREIDEDVMNLKLHAANVVSEAIRLRLEKLTADIAQDLASYPVGNKVTLLAGDKFTNPASNPFTVFEAGNAAVRAKIAKSPNVCVLGPAAFSALKNHPAITDRIKYTQHAIVTEDLLKTLLGYDQLYVGKAVYYTDAGTFANVWSDNVVLAYVPMSSEAERSQYAPTFAYTFRKKGYPVVDTYDENGKVLIVRNTDLFVPKIVGPDAGYLINDTNA